MKAVIALVLALATATTTGAVYAADGAAPGDALYGLDRATEEIHLRLTRNPEQAAALGLRMAEERLAEAQELWQKAENDGFEEAMRSFHEMVIEAAREVEATEGAAREELTLLLDETMNDGREQLGAMLQGLDDEDPDDDDGDGEDPADDGEDEGEEAEDDPADSAWCAGEGTHPAAQGLAQTHAISYTQVISWFCDGYGIGEIRLALRTSERADVPAGELLAMKTEMGGWGLVWQELGLIGNPDDVSPPDDDDPPEDEDGDDDDDPAGSPWCAGESTHPELGRLAQTYAISYTDVISWFCDGYGVGEIKLALRTSEQTEDAFGELLERKSELGGWGLLWQELGLIGAPEAGGPPEDAGPPEHAGPPDGAGGPGAGGQPNHGGHPESPGPPPHAGPPDHGGPPNHAGPPNQGGPPNGRGRGN